MKSTDCKSIYSFAKALPFALLMLASPASALAQTDDATAQQQIRSLLSKTFDKPDHKVEASPVVVADDYAIADWIQADNGGRALLRRQHGQWEIMACGGDGLKKIEALRDAGIAQSTANNLITQLNKAEKNIPAERLKRFNLFGNTDFQAHKNHH